MDEDCNDRNRIIGRLKLKMHGKTALKVIGDEEERRRKNEEEQMEEKKIMPYILKH